MASRQIRLFISFRNYFNIVGAGFGIMPYLPSIRRQLQAERPYPRDREKKMRISVNDNTFTGRHGTGAPCPRRPFLHL